MITKLKKVFLVVLIIFTFSCYKELETDKSILTEKEALFKNELNEELPDFSSPTIEDHDCFVEGMPEPVTWLTSKPADLGSPNTRIGGVFRSVISEYPTTFRYMGPNSNTSTRHLVWTSAGLVDINPETQEPMPYAATHWAFGEDGRTVYFKLNEKAKWSDGFPCTADDFLFSVEFMRSPYLEDPGFYDYATQFEINKINDYCISMTNVSPVILPPLTLLDLVNINPRPKHFYNGEITEDWIEKYDQIPEPTTGPYAIDITDSVPGQMLVFTRVPHWWARSYDHLKKTANISKIEYIVLNDTDSLEKLFYEGKIDLFDINSKEAWDNCDLKLAVKNGYVTKYVFNYVPLTGIRGISFNTETNLFSSKKIRQAMYYALDIQGMIDAPLKGEPIRYHNIGIGQVWAGVSYNDSTIKKPDFNPEIARSIFNEEGYINTGDDGILVNENGDRLSFELLYMPKSVTQQLVYLKDKAREAGVEIILAYYPNYIEKLLSGDFEAAGQEFSTWFFPEYWQYFSRESYETPFSLNIWNYTSPEMEELLSINEKLTDIKSLAENNKKIEQLVHEEALIVPTHISNFMRVLSWRWIRFPAWGNLRHITNDFDPYGYMWIDESVKIDVQKAINNGKILEKNEYHLSERYLNDTF